MAYLDLDIKTFAHIMGETMAMMHWAAHCDASEVDFVLGSSAMRERERETSTTELFVAGFA